MSDLSAIEALFKAVIEGSLEDRLGNRDLHIRGPQRVGPTAVCQS